MSTILAPTSFGELIDKITILEIKRVRIAEPEKRRNVENELAALCRIRDAAVHEDDTVRTLTEELLHINEALWDIEDAIRRCESAVDFGADFVSLARSVYKQNDRRSAVKRRINEALGSDLIEEKSYAPYE